MMGVIMGFNRASLAKLAATVAGAILATGCVTQQRTVDLYAAAEAAGHERRLSRTEGLPPPSQVIAETGAPLELASFRGIEGARKAREMYPTQIAEKFDGRCEGLVRIGHDETLVDIADLCDVPFTELVQYNPGIDNPYLVQVGRQVVVPAGIGLSGNADALGVAKEIADLYTVRPGDTLEGVAYRFNVSALDIVKSNPGVDWSVLGAGDQLRLPSWTPGNRLSASPTVRPTSGYGANAITSGAAPAQSEGTWQREGEGLIDDDDEDAYYDVVTALMPYRLGPVDAPGQARAARTRPGLSVSAAAVEPGDTVTVSVDERLPEGTVVTFYRGRTMDDMAKPKSVVVGKDGRASQRYEAPEKKSDMGGMMFKATRSDEPEPLYSERVGVVHLKKPSEILAEKDEEDEEDDDEDEDEDEYDLAE